LTARDAAGLIHETTLDFTTRAEEDRTPPVFSKRPWQDDAQATRIRVRMELDEPVTGEMTVSVGDESESTRTVRILTPARQLSFDATDLTPDTEYAYTVRVQDAMGNVASATGTARTLAAAVAPAIIEGPTRSEIGYDRARIEVKTDRVAQVAVMYFPIGDLEGALTERSGERGTDHSVLLTNLAADTEYGFSVQAISGSLSSLSIAGTFTTTSGPDLVPPQFQGTPTLSNITDTRIRVVFATDEPSDTQIEVRSEGAAKGVVGSPAAGKVAAGGAVLQAADAQQTRAHEIELTGLTPATRYTYEVFSRDLAGNQAQSGSFEFTTAPAPDILPPEFTRRPVILGRTSESLLLGFSANEVVSVQIDYGPTTAYETGRLERADQLRDYELRLNGLAPETVYQLRVAIRDAEGNGPTVFEWSVATEAEVDTDPAILLTGPVVVSATETEGVVEWSTDEPTSGQVRYWKAEEPDRVFTVEDGALTRTHQMVLSNLEPGTAYAYLVSSRDVARNGPTESAVFALRTRSAPVDPVFTLGPIAEADQQSATISWSTNVPATSMVDLGETLEYGLHFEAGDLVQDHEIVVRNLKPGTVYHYKVTSVDLGGKVISSDPSGLALYSRDLTVRTLAADDEKAPALVANPTTVWTDRAVVVSWETDEVASSRIEWERIGGRRKKKRTGFVEDNELRQQHSLTVTGLRPRRLYAVRVISEDAAGNRMVWAPSGAAKAAAKAAFDRGLVEGPSGKIAQPPGGAGTFVTDSFPDTQFPVLSGGPRVREKTAESLTIEWQTDELADSYVRYGAEEHALVEEVAQARDVQVHSVTLTNLEPATRYFFQVGSTDPSGNGATTSGIEVVTTEAEADLVPPRYLIAPAVQGRTDRQVVLGWRTDEAASARIEYAAEGQEPLVRQVRQRLAQQQVALTNLAPATRYRARIWVQDATQNQVETPFELSVVTDAGPDFSAPRLLGDPEVVSVTDQSALIRWQTDELADAFVDYDQTPYLGGVIGSPVYATEHEVLLTKLEPGAEYFFRAGSTDRAGNGPSTSAILSFTTSLVSDETAPAVPESLVVHAGSEAIYVAWDPVSADDLGGYAVHREDRPGVFAAVATQLAEPYYLDEGLVNGRRYRYRVTALDRQSPPNESAPSLVVSARPDAGAVGDAPEIAGLEAGASAERPIVLIDNALPLDEATELRYTVQVSTQRDFSTIVDRGGDIAEGLSGVTRWRVSRDLHPRSRYWFRARAFDGRFESPWSRARALRPLTAQPALSSEDFDGDGEVGLGDFFLFSSGFGSADAVLDLDGGGVVDAADLQRFTAGFGRSVAGKRQRVRRVETLAGTEVELVAEAVSAGAVVVRLRLAGVAAASGYGFRLRSEPPILRFAGRLDSLALGGPGASLQLTHAEEGVVSLGEHLRGRQPAQAFDPAPEIVLRFEFIGPPRDVDLRIEEGVVGTGRGRLQRVERRGAARVVPQVYALYANYPNPFNPTTVIPLAIPASGEEDAALMLYNALGQTVRRWSLRAFRPGFHTLVWDGRDQQGRALASGVYLVRLNAGEIAQVRKIMLLR